MKVYVLEVEQYETHILGVFATPEAAMAEWNPKKRTPDSWERMRRECSYEWKHYDKDFWGFDAVHGDYATVTAWEVQEAA